MNARLAYASAQALPRPLIKEARQSLGILTARQNHHTPNPTARICASRVQARALRTRLSTPVRTSAPAEFLPAWSGERAEPCAARRENQCEREDWKGSWFDDPCGLSAVSATSGLWDGANVKVDRRCGADRPQPSPPPAPHYHRDGLRARSTVRSNEWLGAFVETGESLPAEVCSVLQE